MSEIHALLIGIDAYLPSPGPHAGYYPCLEGCVHDVRQVEGFLRTRLGVSPERIEILTATDAGSGEPPEPRDRWPTYDNLVAALERLTAAAQPGDPVYIHYSGHGARAKTAYPEAKGDKGCDETLVPLDIEGAEGRYLRDLELAYLLQKMVARGLVVTVVLDSCHSGGVPRTETPELVKPERRARQRGTGRTDWRDRRTDSRVASAAELVATWKGCAAPQETTGVRLRTFQLSTGWLPTPRGYVLIAACSPQEAAHEYPFEGDISSGALTHFLLGAFAELAPGATYEALYRRLRARVQGQFWNQTPMVVGEIQRPVIGLPGSPGASPAEKSPHPQGVLVLAVEEDGRLRLNCGQAQGTLDGARFAVYSPDADLARPGEPLAEVEVTQYGATESLAEIVGESAPRTIPAGSQAVLLDPGPSYRRTAVRVAPDLAAVAALLQGTPYLRPAAEGEPAELTVASNARQEIEIRDAWGPIPHLGLPRSATETGAATQTVERLVHLAKHRAIRELRNPRAPEDLAGKVVVELIGVKEQPSTRRPEPGAVPGTRCLDLEEGQWTLLRVTNRSSLDLNIAILALRPDWSIAQVFPIAGEESLYTLDAATEDGEPLEVELRAQLPPGLDHGTDVLKVFATVGAADFRFLELPALAPPLVRMRSGIEVRLLPRHPEWFGIPTKDWTTAEVELRVRRRALGRSWHPSV